MTRNRAALFLWLATVLLAPLPIIILAEGSIPLVRMMILTSVAGYYTMFIDGSGVAWPMTTILVLQVVVYGLALAVASWAVAALLPERARGRVVGVVIAAGLLLAISTDLYRTPFDDKQAQASWVELFR